MPIDRKYGRVTLENQRRIADDEPVFVFRAQDQLLPGLLLSYRDQCTSPGHPRIIGLDHGCIGRCAGMAARPRLQDPTRSRWTASLRL